MLRKMVIGSLIVTSVVQVSFSYDIKNAKKGSVIISDWNTNRLPGTEGHAGVIISEYKNDKDTSFIIGAHGEGVRHDSFYTHLVDKDTGILDNHLGHFRCQSDNYTFSQRTDIASAAIKAVGKSYEFLNLYIYDFDYNHKNNTPYNSNVVPTDFRCDGLAEWTTEVSVNNGIAKESDGFYVKNIYRTNKPLDITAKQVDIIGTPKKPTLSLTSNNKVSVQFPKVSGAWSKALYAVYRSDDTGSSSSVPKKVHCSSGLNLSYIDKDVEPNNTYSYMLMIGERIASCNDLPEYYYGGGVNNWSHMSEISSIKTKGEENNVDSGSSIIDGAGSIINPDNSCWGCNKDEADMQIHSSNPSTVVFQWTSTDSCPYLDIGILDEQTYGVSEAKLLGVTIYRKAWDDTSATTYKTTLPITVSKKAYWNTIAVTSQQPISSTKKIVAFCSKSIAHSPSKQTINNTNVQFESGYTWAGNSSIIRRSNPTSTQSDGIYKDVALGLSDRKSVTLFQWQPSSNCLKLKLKSGQYPSGNGKYANVDSVYMKSWYSKIWNLRNKCNGKLPCTLNAPNGADGYYIIRVRAKSSAFDKNRISAVCTQ